ncbi:hypothetical protein [Pseudomonas sp. HAR-UPW-AIA-41]|uniref:hypothetical protein n=1 Tax=Pseudomonas sp. HAR-UPW-AIA-41 TaxID=1985301 RepID=UPI0011448609|nr:hypothetical protein [Pseudomonas sp. HAR-UPW-AIA-41]
MRITTIAPGFIFLFACTTSYAAPSKCYTITDRLQDFSATEETWGEATSFLKIINIEKEKIEFELKQYGANFHTCGLPGFAFKQADGTFVFKDEKEYWPRAWELHGISQSNKICEIHFGFTENRVSITTVNSCHSFCGARASIGGSLNKSENCDQYSLP